MANKDRPAPESKRKHKVPRDVEIAEKRENRREKKRALRRLKRRVARTGISTPPSQS